MAAGDGAADESIDGAADSTADAEEIADLAALSGADRAAVRAFLLRLADDEFVVAERYTEWQVRAPTLESDIALSNIAQDELGHARLWYGLVERLGADEIDLIWERDPAQFRHATLVERPFAEGDWADAIVRSFLYDVAEDIRLDAVTESALVPVRDRVGKIRAEEEYHLDHADTWLERLVADEEGRRRVQDAVDRLYPHAHTLFEPTEYADRIDELGLRTATLDEIRSEWTARVEGTLSGLDLSVPEADPPAAVGRDGTHTDHWPALHDEMTRTYRELGRDSATRIMDRDEEGDA